MTTEGQERPLGARSARSEPESGTSGPDTHGWAFDPDWRYFVRRSEFVTDESIGGFHPEALDELGLTLEVRWWLRKHPTKGAYR